MNNTIIIICLVVILAIVVFNYFDAQKSQTAFMTLAVEQLEALKTQSGTMKLQYEIALKQAEIMEKIAVNLEDKINAQRMELDFYTQNFEEWKTVYNVRMGMVENGRKAKAK